MSFNVYGSGAMVRFAIVVLVLFASSRLQGQPLDSDQDQVPDSVECPAGTFPDTDGDGITDCVDWDDDGDGINSADEGSRDSDGDGVEDRLDTDDDGDGKPTVFEFGRDCDGKPAHVDPNCGTPCGHPISYPPGCDCSMWPS